MYDIFLMLFDDVLMSPDMAPFTTIGFVILIMMTVASVLSDGTAASSDEDDT